MNTKTKEQYIGRYVVLDDGTIIDTHTWGMHSWGDHKQHGLDIRGNEVYGTIWMSHEGEEEYEDYLLGKIVYSTDIPLQVCECISAMSYSTQPKYTEYGIDVDKYFGIGKV